MDSQEKKSIVVIGGGFAGVAAIKELLRLRANLRMKITLIDTNPYHLFTPSLYEVATSEMPPKNIVISFKELFGDKIQCIQAYVEKIDKDRQVISVKNKEIPYDYLILSAGSVPAYHHIPGLEENSVSLKSLSDAREIKNKIKTLCCKEGECNKKVHLVIGGGGFSGTELAAELLTYKDKLAKENHLAKDCLNITIIQGSARLLKELDQHVSTLAQKRLATPVVHFAFGGHIQEVTKTNILTDNGKSYPYDIFIWTGGVKANSIADKSKLTVNKKGQAVVNTFLQIAPHIFAAGDIAGFINPKTQSPVPNVAQVAEEQGKIAGKNVYSSLMDTPLIPYHFRHWGYIVPLKGRFAAAELMGIFHFDGYVGWVLQQLVFLRYLLGILPLWKALGKWIVFERNLHQ